MKKMSSAGLPLPKRPAPPVPVPRNSKSDADVGKTLSNLGNQNLSSLRPSNSKIAQMNEEILRYRTKGNFALSNEVGSSDQRSKDECASEQDMESIKRELQDVVEKNGQWQMYNEQREEYVKDLIQKYNDLHQRFHQIQESYTMLTNNPDKLSDERRRYFDGLLVQARQELGASHDEVENLKSQVANLKSGFRKEKKKLEEEIDHWRAMYEQEKEVTAKLREDRDKYDKQKHLSRDTNKENRDRLVSLQREMELYREDFRSERRKREELERRLDSIQETMNHDGTLVQKRVKHRSRSENQPGEFRSEQRDYKRTVSAPKLKKYILKDEVQVKSHGERRSHPVDPINVTTRARRTKGSRAHKQQEDSLRTSDRMNRTYHEFGHSKDSNLCCPNCGKAYGVDEHEFLLIHIDSCI